MPDNLEDQSSASLAEIAKRAEKALSVTQSQIDRQKREGKLARDEKFLDHFNWVKLAMMWSFGVFAIIFFIMVFASAFYMPDLPSKGWLALEGLFVTITDNIKPILLILLGFFFRDYIPLIGDKKDE